MNIKALRRKANISQKEFAAMIGVTNVAMCYYENGKRRIPVSLLPAIKDALGCTWEELFDERSES